MNTLFILNGAPYGAEPTYNGLRLAGALARMEHQTVRLFLMGDAAGGAKAGQKVPEGYYNVLHMLGRVAAEEIGEGIHRGTLDELAQWTAWADKVLVF
ncbi:MAG: DsrE family protein [Rhodocyclaceae bacterium]|nr:DsrE family protein [Rhodocyclaceae bacterium]